MMSTDIGTKRHINEEPSEVNVVKKKKSMFKLLFLDNMFAAALQDIYI